jgi:hypothetical protein
MKAFYILLTIVLLAACAPSNEQLTATALVEAAQAQTAAPTLTHTVTPQPTPTSTLIPTSTPTETPKPVLAALGESVKLRGLEITVLEVATHSHIVTGGYYSYYSKEGEIFLDVAVLVRNTETVPVTVEVGDIYIIEETGDTWYSNFSGLQSVEVGRQFNALATLKLEKNISRYEKIQFQKDTYLRLVYYTKQNQHILFGIQNSPQIVLTVD